MADKYTVVDGDNHPEKLTITASPSRNEDISSRSSSSDEDAGLEEGVDTRCGVGRCRPAWLQRFNNPPVLCACICVYTLIHGFAVNGINNVNATSYERRFDLTSSSVGWITSSFDISAAICGVIIGFYGNRRNKGRILTMAFLLSSIGSTCMYLPHMITPEYEWGQGRSHLCSSIEPESTCVTDGGGLPNFLALFVVGQLLHGIGGSTLITVGYSFIDDSVPASASPMYISLIGLCQMLGPMIGFLVGGALLDMYVDFERIPESQWELTPADPRWVGAWWTGFLISSVLMFIFSLPFSLFGAELPSAKRVRETRVSETHNDGRPTSLSAGQSDALSVRDFPTLLCRLLRNPAFMCVAFASAFMGLVTVSVAAFLPKYIQNVYETTASSSATFAGLIIIPGAALGQIIGGFVIRYWKLKVKDILKLTIIIVFLASLSKSCFFINCDTVLWDTDVNVSTPVSASTISSCNQDCHCDETVFQVVCDKSGRKFYSPCLAGCHTDIGNHGKGVPFAEKEYSDCHCVSSAINVTSVTMENCVPSTCNSLLYIFLFIIFLSALFVSGSTVPALTVVLRCAHENERTFALGLLNFIARVIGTIPGPIMYGSVIDSTCQMWGHKCGRKTSCWQYNKASMGRYMAVLGMGFTGLAIFFFIMAYKLYKPPVPRKKSLEGNREQELSVEGDATNNLCDSTLPAMELTEETGL